MKEFDLSVQNRDYTDDKVTYDALDEIKLTKAGVKCATITPTDARLREFRLKKLWKSPNATIRHEMDGALFSEAIIFESLPKHLKHWRDSIIVARHSHAD